MPGDREHPLTWPTWLSRGAVLVLAASLLAGHARASVLSAVNRVRETACTPRSGVPLSETRGADQVATRLLYGDTLHRALGTLPLRPAFAGSLHLVSVTDERSIAAAVATRFCRDLSEPGVSELGVAASGRDLWLVALAPLAVPAPRDAPAVAREIVDRVNAARARGRRCGNRNYDLAMPLSSSPLLDQAAAEHADDMARSDTLVHDGMDGSLPADRVRRTGYAARVVGENIASGVPDADGVVDGWLASPPHCANVMDRRFTEMGVAFAVNAASKGAIYWTQVLAVPR